MRFAAPDADGRYYERRIAESGTVPTRPGHWHDTYNALIWLRFPRIKAALNARHVRAMETMAVAGRRGPERDFLTLVDESGAIVCCPAPDLLELWRAHRWRELFVDRRERLEREFRVILFGHSLYEQLHAPFPALTARALVLDGAEALGMGDAELDAHLAARLAAGDWPVLKAASLPLPLLGVPGWWPANEAPAFYDDAEVFRPRPSPGPRSRGRRA
ncbi:MAG: DUF3025 domain-containing protein [Gammaproteobacteria bacterium]|nr:DUF3025 domain-containing protein [Gammaproteobacteria bacterium]